MKPEEHWQKSIAAKLKQIQDIHSNVLEHLPKSSEPKFRTYLDGLTAAVKGLMAHYGPGTVPRPLECDRDTLAQWTSQVSNHSLISRFVIEGAALPSILSYDTAKPPRFSEFLEGFGDDPSLQGDVDALIAKLEQIAKDCDEQVANRLMLDLLRILNGLRADRKSLTDLTPWLDFAFRVCAAIFDQHAGTIAATFALEAGKLALGAKVKVIATVDRAEREFVLKIGLPAVAKRLELPLPTEADLDRKLAEGAAPRQITE